MIFDYLNVSLTTFLAAPLVPTPNCLFLARFARIARAAIFRCRIVMLLKIALKLTVRPVIIGRSFFESDHWLVATRCHWRSKRIWRQVDKIWHLMRIRRNQIATFIPRRSNKAFWATAKKLGIAAKWKFSICDVISRKFCSFRTESNA